MTLRDLFRWGERYRLANTGLKNNHDWEQHLADEGIISILFALQPKPNFNLCRLLGTGWQSQA